MFRFVTTNENFLFLLISEKMKFHLSGFLVFSEDIEKEHWPEMGRYL